MKTLSIQITDQEFANYGLSKEEFSFDEFLALLNKELAKKSLKKARVAAQKSGLDQMSDDEINQEINEVRQEQKRRRYAQSGS